MITFFHFQVTYNSRLRERYEDDPSTHPDFDPDLWMEVGSSGGRDKNKVYGLSNTTALRARTCGWPVVSQRLGAPNQYWAPNLRSSWPCSNTRLISPKNTSDYRRIMNTSSNGYGDEITYGWYMCAPFLAVWSRERPASSFSSSSVIILV